MGAGVSGSNALRRLQWVSGRLGTALFVVGYNTQWAAPVFMTDLFADACRARVTRAFGRQETRFQKTRLGMSHSVFGDVDLVGYSLQGQGVFSGCGSGGL